MLNTTLIDRYRIDTEIGQGGMGTVFRARDLVLNRDVAIKELSNFKLGTEGKARLLGEAQTVAQLNHPNIVSVFDAGEHDGFPFIVMEYVEGHTLREDPPKEWEEIINVARQICASLKHAHSHDIIHRDLKPENVIVDPDGTAKLMDFGIAHSASSRITTDGMVIGTVYYMSPEQAMGKSVDIRSDLYSLGVMLYEFATGELPFKDYDPIAIISQHINAPIVPPRGKRDEIPPGLDSLIMRLLEKDPQDRPASAADVLKILDDPLFLDTAAHPIVELSTLDRIVRGRMVGRRHELEQARLLWKEVTLGNGQSLLISGDPGIGKTRLAREILTHAEITGGQSFLGESYAEGGVPYDAFTQIIRKVLRSKNGSDLDLPDFVLADLIELSPELKPYFPHIEPNPALEPEPHQRRLFENMVTFCKALSTQAPLLLVIDDAHWSDSGTLHMLRHLMRRTRKLPIMLIATYREVELDEALPFYEVLLDLNRERLGARIKLTRLERDETRQMLGVIFNDEITQEFLDGIYKETEGNPFFVEEVCKALIESGKVFYQDGGWDRVDMSNLEIPPGVKVAIQYRVSKLPPASKDAMVAAAVIGREFDFSTLLEVTDGDEDSLITAIEDAAKAQLIEEMRHTSGEHFSFSHALIPAAMRETLGGLRRNRLHRRVAAALQDLHPEDYERLAYHYSEAGQEERGLEFTIKAAQRAKDSYANDEAIRFFTEALSVVPKDSPKRFQLLQGRERAYNHLARRQEQSDDLVEMLSLAERLGDDSLLVDTLTAQADYFMRADKLKDQLLTAKRVVKIAESLKDPARLGVAYHELGKAYNFTGELSKGENVLRKAVALLKQENKLSRAAFALHRLYYAQLNLNQQDEAFESAQEALTLSRQAGNAYSEAQSLAVLAQANFLQSNFQQALTLIEQAIQQYYEIGLLQLKVYSHFWAAFVHRALGQQEENLAALEAGIDLMWDIDEPSIAFLLLKDYSIFRYLDSGEIEKGLKLLSSQITEAENTNNPNMVNMIRFAQSIFQIHIGQYRSSAKTIEIVRAKDLDMAHFIGWTYDLLLGWCYLGLGEFNEALQIMQSSFEEKMQITQDKAHIADMLGSLAWAIFLVGDAAQYPAALKQVKQAIQCYQSVPPGPLERLGYCIAHDVASRLQLALDRPEDALESSQQLADIVENEIIEVTAPYLYTHSLVLRANHQEEEADAYLQKAYDRVASVAEKIQDPVIKSDWLESHRQNREIVEAYNASPPSTN